MQVERLNSDQIRITLSSKVDEFGLQRLIDYLTYLEATANSKVNQKDIDNLADEINESWWEANKSRFIK